MTGTGDGGGALVGGSRKIKSFLWMVLAVMLLVFMTTKIHTPDEIAIQALWVVGVGGLFTVGGQSLVDAVARWKGGVAESKTVTKEQTITEKQP